MLFYNILKIMFNNIAPPRLASEPQPQQQQPANAGPSPSRSVPASVAASCQNGANRSSQSVAGGAKPGVLPANLDEFKVRHFSNGSFFPCIIEVSILLMYCFFRLQSLSMS